MLFSSFSVPAVVSFFHLIIAVSRGEDGCEDRKEEVVRVVVRGQRNETGDWVTNFVLSKDDAASGANASNGVHMDLSQAVIECNGKRTLQIRGLLTGMSLNYAQQSSKTPHDKLHFHTTCGSSVAVLSDGKTIRKIDVDKDGNMLALTHRAMRSNEVLEVRLEKKHSKFAHSLGIGLTTELPRFASNFRHINDIVNQSWALYDGAMFQNGKKTMESYGIPFSSFAEGTRFGVMRSNTGSLHYFINGEDQGPAASNVPYPVYGVVELRGHALIMTIVNS